MKSTEPAGTTVAEGGVAVTVNPSVTRKVAVVVAAEKLAVAACDALRVTEPVPESVTVFPAMMAGPETTE